MTDPAAHDSPSERDADPLDDLDALEARVWRLTCSACGAVDPPTERGEFFEGSVFDRHIGCPKQPELFAAEVDVHGLKLSQQRALVAEVRRLRDELDNLRENIAIATTVPRLMDETMAALHREERDALRARLATTPPDDPEADGTDAAHPAWWRGNDAGCKGAMSLLARLRADNDALRARVAELERVVKGDTTPPTDAEIDAHDGPWWIVLDHAAGFAARCAEGDEAKVWARRQRERGAAYVWRAFHMSTGELVPRGAAAAPKPMGFAESLDAVRRGPVGPSGCARCGEIATAACDACGVHLCSVCGATPTCDDGDPCALRRYPHPDKEPLLCVDLDAWGRALG